MMSAENALFSKKMKKGRAQKLQSSAVVIGTIKVNLNLVDVSLNYKAVSQFKNADGCKCRIIFHKNKERAQKIAVCCSCGKFFKGEITSGGCFLR